MKRKINKHVLVFFISLACFSSFLPLSNLIYSGSLSLKNAFNLDPVIQPYSWAAVQLGMSVDPQQVVIGYDDWYFLGDMYRATRTTSRTDGNNPLFREKVSDIANTQSAIKQWLLENDIDDYKIIIGPNKSSLYQDKLPRWLKSAEWTLTDELLQQDSDEIYFDTRPALSGHSQLVYYRTDTHWNQYGGALAFGAFINDLSESHPDLVKPKPRNYTVKSISKINSLGLTRMLKVGDYEHDIAPVTKLKKRKHRIFDRKNNLVYQGTNPLYLSMNELQRIVTPSALNDKRVLWLSDSFGKALAPYMTYTFKQVVKIHWSQVLGTSRLQKLVNRFKPDFVFLTVVERDLHAEVFTRINTPAAQPLTMLSNPNVLQPVRLNQLDETEGTFTVTGDDPYIVYSVQKTSGAEHHPTHLSIKLQCRENDEPDIGVEIFWRNKSHSFTSSKSKKLRVSSDGATFPVKRLSEEDISEFRLDIDSIQSCSTFQIEKLALGVLH